MAGTYFAPVQVLEDGGRYRSEPPTTGPWSPGLQHGGPPNALLVHTAERLAAALDGGPYRAMRLAAEFLGPVPVAEVEVHAQVLRHARSAVLVRATLSSDARDCLHARVWLVRESDTAEVCAARAATLGVAEPPPPPDDVAASSSGGFPWGESIEWRALFGSFHSNGPAAMWTRPRIELLPGVPALGLARGVLVGDAASGISSELDWDTWSFVNLDLDVHLFRPLTGDWVLIDATTRLGPTGVGLARATLSDIDGPAGSTAQTLLLAPQAD